MRKEIKTREDLFFLVDEFYKRVRQDEEIGWVFNEIITDWPRHLELITDFWEFHVFKTSAYRGNPMQAHIGVDQKIGQKITPKDFGTWLFHWMGVINEYFEGDNAEVLKFKARKMQTMLYMGIHESRTSSSS